MLYRFEVKRHSRRPGALDDAGARPAFRPGTLALALAAYRSAERFALPRSVDGVPGRRTIDYSRRGGVVRAVLLAPPTAPEWAHDRQSFWLAVEEVERRKDALLALEHVVSLPRELRLETSADALFDWVRHELVGHGLVADVAIHAYGTPLEIRTNAEHARHYKQIVEPDWPVHEMPAKGQTPKNPPDRPHVLRYPDGSVRIYQPHAHILFSLRPVSAFGFQKKLQQFDGKKNLYHWRQSWAARLNGLLEQAGRPERAEPNAGWKVANDAAIAAGLPAAALRPARIANCDGGYHAALAGRPPIAAPLPGMEPMDFNQQLQAERRRTTAVEAARDQALAEAESLDAERLKLTDLLSQREIDDDNAAGDAEAARRAAAEAKAELVEARKQCDAAEQAVKEAAARQQATPDDKLDRAMAIVAHYEAQRVVFRRGPKDQILTEPVDAIRAEDWKVFRGQHKAVLAAIDNRKTPDDRFEDAKAVIARHAAAGVSFEETPAGRVEPSAPISPADAQVFDGQHQVVAEVLMRQRLDAQLRAYNEIAKDPTKANAANPRDPVAIGLIEGARARRTLDRLKPAIETFIENLKTSRPAIGAFMERVWTTMITWAEGPDPHLPGIALPPHDLLPIAPAARSANPPPSASPTPAAVPRQTGSPGLAQSGGAPPASAAPLGLPVSALRNLDPHIAELAGQSVADLQARLTATAIEAIRHPDRLEECQIGAFAIIEALRKRGAKPSPQPSHHDFVSKAYGHVAVLRRTADHPSRQQPSENPNRSGPREDRDR